MSIYTIFSELAKSGKGATHRTIVGQDKILRNFSLLSADPVTSRMEIKCERCKKQFYAQFNEKASLEDLDEFLSYHQCVSQKLSIVTGGSIDEYGKRDLQSKMKERKEKYGV